MHVQNGAEAKQAREKVPVEYRPAVKQESLVKSFKAALAHTDSPVAINNSAKPTQAIIGDEDPKRLKKPFNAAATPQKNNDISVWKKKIKLEIKSLYQARSKRTPIPIKEPMNSPKVWKVEANDRGRTILNRMQLDIRERKAAEPTRNKEGFSGRFNHPTRMGTEKEVIRKVRAEAEIVHMRVGRVLSVKAYSSKATKHARTPRIPDHFTTAGRWPLETGHLKKMSLTFNIASKATSLNPALNAVGPKIVR